MYTIVPKEVNRLGSYYDGEGVHFAIFSENADYIELCIFDGRHETRLPLPARTDEGIWHGYVKGLQVGAKYGYRVHGPYDPSQGKRFNPYKLLLDPYAKAFDSEIKWHDSILGYNRGGDTNTMNTSDNSDFVTKSVVIDEDALHNYQKAEKPNIPWHKTILYEAHVKGMTILNDDIHRVKRGTFSGLSEKKVIEYIKSLGISSLELLPVFANCVDRYLGAAGLENYWGYDTVGFFAPRHSYGDILEFKKMINSLHDAGIEVILDVVYNHTGDSDETGPTLAFKGIDNQYYYKLDEYNPSFYKNFAGCGNVLDINKPFVKKMVQDSLLYWTKIGVDGFRFDLASVLGRDEYHNFNPNSQFFNMIKETKELDDVKLIAEPWDATGEGFQLGNYPNNFRQWNSKYRDTLRTAVSSKEVKKGDIAYALSGSDGLGNNNNHSLSINYLFAHDGFTMKDYFTYSHKRNEANPWMNNDGPNEEGYNCGIEGETKDKQVNQERFLRMKNSFVLLMMSIGVPMFLAGDERARTQQGNNNAYCQDNKISYLDWNVKGEQKDLQKFVASLIKFRQENSDIFGDKLLSDKDIIWLDNDANPIEGSVWDDTLSRSLNYLLEEKIFIAINLSTDDAKVKLPAGEWKLHLSSNSKSKFQGQFYQTSSQEIAIFTK